MTTKTRKRFPPGFWVSPEGKKMAEVRCVDCGKYLCYEAINVGIIQHSCHACKSVTQCSVMPGGDDTPPEKMQAVRCGKCGRFLYKEAIIQGTVRTKCRGCGEWNTLSITEEKVLSRQIEPVAV